MILRNVSPVGDLHIPALGVDVPAGETFEVADAGLAAAFLAQPDNFQEVEA